MLIQAAGGHDADSLSPPSIWTPPPSLIWQLGTLSVLVLRLEGGAIAALSLERLGHTSQPSSLSYLDNGVAFVGSSFGDSKVRARNSM